MRASVALALACICTLLGCGSDDARTSPTSPSSSRTSLSSLVDTAGPANPPVGAWVVIDDEFNLHEKADIDARLVPTPRDRLPNQERLVARVVAKVEGFFMVRTIEAPPERGCASERGLEQDYELTFFVLPDALQLVLARPKLIEFDDGTKLEFAAGVPGIEGGVRVGNTQLDVRLDPQDVGWWYPAPKDELPGRPHPLLWGNERELHYGDRVVHPDLRPPFVHPHERQIVEDHQLLTFINACGRFVLKKGFDPSGRPRP